MSEGCFIFHYASIITFVGSSAHLAYLVHTSGRKTSTFTLLQSKCYVKEGDDQNPRYSTVFTSSEKNPISAVISFTWTAKHLKLFSVCVRACSICYEVILLLFRTPFYKN